MISSLSITDEESQVSWDKVVTSWRAWWEGAIGELTLEGIYSHSARTVSIDIFNQASFSISYSFIFKTSFYFKC